MIQLKKHLLASLAATTVGLLSLEAEESVARNDSDLPLYVLDDYVVVAHTYAVPYVEVGSKVEIITRDELELGQSAFVLDALRELPGVTVRNNGGPGAVFGITTRGLNSNRPTVLIDGIEVSNPSTAEIINPGYLFSNSVERIEFLKGPQSSLYGADALAGVISIETRTPEADGQAGSISAGYGSYNTREGSINYSFQEGAFDLTLGLNYFKSDGFSAQQGDTEDDGYENLNLSAKLGYQATENTQLYLVAYTINSETEYDGFFDNFGLTEEEQIFAKAGANVDITEDWQTQLSFAFSKASVSIQDSFGEYPTEGDRYKADWRNIISVKESWTVATGLEYELEDNRDAEGQRDNSSVYIDNTAEIVDGLNWTIGGRYDDNSDYGTNETWRTTLSYQIEPLKSRLHASYGTSFDSPTFYEISNPLYGNPNLKPEEGEGWDAGIEVTLIENKLIVDATAFGNQIDNKISFITLTSFPDPFTGTYINDESYESNGVEGSLTWLACEHLQIKANYTYTDAEYEDGTRAERVPRHLANLSATLLLLDEALRLKGTVNYIGKQKDRRFSTTEQPDYATVNLAGQYSINETFTLWARLNNILDKDYEEIAGFNTPGFNATAGVRLNF